MKILVGYDGSNAAREAVRVAKVHAKAFGASVEVVTSMLKGSEHEQEEIIRIIIKALENIHATPAYLGPEEWTAAVKQQYKDLAKVIDNLGIRAK